MPARDAREAALEALEECEKLLALGERIPREDPVFGKEVRSLGERIGFGAMMTSAQASWRERLLRGGCPPGGEHAVVGCHVMVVETLARVRSAAAALRESAGVRVWWCGTHRLPRGEAHGPCGCLVSVRLEHGCGWATLHRHSLRESAERPAPWTKDVPMTGRWYWLRESPEAAPRAVFVEWGRSYVRSTGVLRPYAVDYEWLGPLSPESPAPSPSAIRDAAEACADEVMYEYPDDFPEGGPWPEWVEKFARIMAAKLAPEPGGRK